MGKKHRDYDFDMDDQQAMLDNIDAFIGGEATVASFAEEPEEKDNDEWMESIGAMLGFRTPKDEKEKSVIDTIINTPVDTSNFKPAFQAMDEENDDIRKNEKFFSIVWDEENEIVSFSDEIRIYDIDLKTLTADDNARYMERSSSKEDFEHNIREDFSETIYNILTCFYPKAIFTKAKLAEVFRGIKEFDDTRFMFFDHPAQKNVVLGYEILDAHWEDADFVISRALERRCAISLLVAMETIFNSDGVSFRNADSDLLNKLMVTKDYKENQDFMIKNLYESQATKIDESATMSTDDTLSDVVEIGTFLGSAPLYKSDFDKLKDIIQTTKEEKIQVSSVYGEFGNHVNNEEESEEEKGTIEEVVTVTSETVEIEGTVETIELPEDEEVELPDIVDNVEEASEIELPVDEDEMDHDEAEEMYFGSKKPRTSMKSSKPISDDEFVVTRRK